MMVLPEYRVGLTPNRATVVGDDSSWERERNPHYVVVSFAGTKVHGNETSRYLDSRAKNWFGYPFTKHSHRFLNCINILWYFRSGGSDCVELSSYYLSRILRKISYNSMPNKYVWNTCYLRLLILLISKLVSGLKLFLSEVTVLVFAARLSRYTSAYWILGMTKYR